jgi:Zn-dependent metalloprotease
LTEILEDRSLLSWSNGAPDYLPPQHHLFDYDGYLSSPSAAEPISIARDYLLENVDDLGLVPSDLDNLLVTTNYASSDTGVTHLTFQQTLHGLEVANAKLNVNIAHDGSVINVGGGFVPNLSSLAGQSAPLPGMTAEAAIVRAAEYFGLTSTDSLSVKKRGPGSTTPRRSARRAFRWTT